MTTSVISRCNDSISNIKKRKQTSFLKDIEDDKGAAKLLELKRSEFLTSASRNVKSHNNLDGLDALAVLCSSATLINDTEIDEEVPPMRRQRSVSNPEGMEKWDALSRVERRRVQYPPSILEEMDSEHETKINAEDDLDMTEVASSLSLLAKDRITSEAFRASSTVVTPEESIDNPTELLRRARTKLFEDLHESGNGKGTSILPHTLSKYRDVYNKNGRIGIYTPSERAAIIARYHDKRTRRVWNKKIRYNCRKNLADRRLRVKGRFVKRSSEEAATALAQVATATSKPITTKSKTTKQDIRYLKPQGLFSLSETAPIINDTNITPSSPSLQPLSLSDGSVMEIDAADQNLPDTNDIEADFDPTSDQPFRRKRRHTIT